MNSKNLLLVSVELELEREMVSVEEEDGSNEKDEYMDEDSSHRQSSVVVKLTTKSNLVSQLQMIWNICIRGFTLKYFQLTSICF